MTKSEWTWLKRIAPNLKGPFLEIGSRIPDERPSQPQLRTLWPGEPYTGVDAQPGPGVDLVADVNGSTELPAARTALCISTLEHTPDPFGMAKAITRALEPGGRLVVCVPFAHAYHGHPSDYWRFTPNGVKVLFGSHIRWHFVYLIGSLNRTIKFGSTGWEQRLRERHRIPPETAGFDAILSMAGVERRAIGMIGTRRTSHLD